MLLVAVEQGEAGTQAKRPCITGKDPSAHWVNKVVSQLGKAAEREREKGEGGKRGKGREDEEGGRRMERERNIHPSLTH